MEYEELVEERLTHAVIGAFFEVYNTLGFGFLEHVYVMALERELRDRGHTVAREVAVRIMYKNEHLSTQRLDMIIDDRLVVETKSTHQLHSAAIRQLFNYLRGTNLEVGLLLHFGPEPKFYRQIRKNVQRNAPESGSAQPRANTRGFSVPDPPNPPHPPPNS